LDVTALRCLPVAWCFVIDCNLIQILGLEKYTENRFITVYQLSSSSSNSGGVGGNFMDQTPS
jgi:hypothetical protein